MPSDRDIVTDRKIDNFITETINDSTIYLNLGLTLASAFAWSDAGKHIVQKVVRTEQGPLFNAIIMTIITAMVFRVTSNRSRDRY